MLTISPEAFSFRVLRLVRVTSWELVVPGLRRFGTATTNLKSHEQNKSAKKEKCVGPKTKNTGNESGLSTVQSPVYTESDIRVRTARHVMAAFVRSSIADTARKAW